MKLLHILKTEPDATTKTLMDILSEERETTVFELYKEPDYEKLLNLIFEHDRTITWW